MSGVLFTNSNIIYCYQIKQFDVLSFSNFFTTWPLDKNGIYGLTGAVFNA